MAPLLVLPEFSNLTLRLLSALVLLPATVALIWLGNAPFTLFLALLAVAMVVELAAMTRVAPTVRTVTAAAVAAIPVLFYFVSPATALAASAVLAALLAFLFLLTKRGERALMLGGCVYFSAGLLAMLWLRQSTDGGLLTVLWLVAVVVATDVGAYFAGRSIGGPKLAPTISPAKTWSGLLGGMLCAAIASWLVSLQSGGSGSIAVIVAGAVLAVVAQCGDLLESGVKRHFDVKDAGSLIPGHGGVLDRLDGFLTVAPVVAIVTWSAGGSPLEWS